MKANNGSGNNESRDIWKTPLQLFNILGKQYEFTFDCCADVTNALCLGFTDNLESMPDKQFEVGWMNPPFSKAEKMFKNFFRVIKKGIAIYRCDNFETKTWQKVVFPNATWIFIPNKRIVYEGQDGSGARFPSALIGFNVDPPKELEGTLLKPS